MVTPITSTTPAKQDSGTFAAGSTVAKDDFLRLLTIQLKNQDPLNPADQEQMLGTLAQFSSLEQMSNLNANVTQLAQTSGLGQSVNLLGRRVSGVDDGNNPVIGVVDRIANETGGARLYVNGQSLLLSQVTEVR